jgi:hypothetical protein
VRKLGASWFEEVSLGRTTAQAAARKTAFPISAPVSAAASASASASTDLAKGSKGRAERARRYDGGHGRGTE